MHWSKIYTRTISPSHLYFLKQPPAEEIAAVLVYKLDNVCVHGPRRFDLQFSLVSPLDSVGQVTSIMTSTPTDKDVVDSATQRSLLPTKTLQFFLEQFSCLPVVKRLELVQKLQHQTKPKQVDKVIGDFLGEKIANTKLRSGRRMELRRGEHRLMAEREALPFDVVIDGNLKTGSSANVRRIKIMGQDFALKSFKDTFSPNKISKEANVMRALSRHHILDVYASLEEASGAAHLILQPWCNVSTFSNLKYTDIVIVLTE